MRCFAALLLVLSGCSVFYGEDFQGAGDLREIEAQPIEILEGQVDVPLLITGRGIAADAVVTVELADPSLVADDAVVTARANTLVASDGRAIARAVDLPVMTGLAAGETTDLIARVTQAGDSGPVSAEVRFAIQGLDELSFVNSIPDTPSIVAIEDHVVVSFRSTSMGNEVEILDHPSIGRDLGETYSAIDLGFGFLIVEGPDPLVLRATSVIDAGNAVLVSGSVFAPGVGGCRAGDGCGGTSSGGSAPVAEKFGCGGLGGGHAVAGGGHAFQQCGTTAGGFVAGNRYLTPLSGEGGAAGGQGASWGGQPGHGGGWGGGAILLSAARIELEVVIVAGGNGLGPLPTPPEVLPTACGSAGEAGGGGGGAGGALLVRARELNLSAADIRLDGGFGGQAVAQTAGLCNGRDGGRGRLRIDSTGLDPNEFDGPPLTRGPVFSVVGGSVVPAAPARLSLAGSPGQVPISIDGQPPKQSVNTSDGLLDLVLEPGIHEVCAYVPYEDLDPPLTFDEVKDLPEAKNCIRVAAVDAND